jgi:type II secretory pathway pseudopilin PulG
MTPTGIIQRTFGRSTFAFPSPRPSPVGRGRIVRRLPGTTTTEFCRWKKPATCAGFSLSPGERVRVRGNHGSRAVQSPISNGHLSKAIARRGFARAFTIVELLVAVSVLTLIVLVLFGLFDQVQKALRSNVAQVDVQEGARAAMQLMSSEMEQINAGNLPVTTNLYIGFNGFTNAPTQQLLGDASTNRINVLEQMFFLSHFNKTWMGTGYRVLFLNTNGIATAFADKGVGTLCRYTFPLNDSDFPNLPPPRTAPNAPRTNLFWQVMNQPLNPAPANLTNYQRVLDGVVHFRLRAFDHNGFLITNSFNTNLLSGVLVNATNVLNSEFDYTYAFTNKALPALVEVELGILEPHVLDRLKSMPPLAAANYFSNQAGAVHLFQQRIPIRSAK